MIKLIIHVILYTLFVIYISLSNIYYKLRYNLLSYCLDISETVPILDYLFVPLFEYIDYIFSILYLLLLVFIVYEYFKYKNIIALCVILTLLLITSIFTYFKLFDGYDKVKNYLFKDE